MFYQSRKTVTVQLLYRDVPYTLLVVRLVSSDHWHKLLNQRQIIIKNFVLINLFTPLIPALNLTVICDWLITGTECWSRSMSYLAKSPFVFNCKQRCFFTQASSFFKNKPFLIFLRYIQNILYKNVNHWFLNIKLMQNNILPRDRKESRTTVHKEVLKHIFIMWRMLEYSNI